MIFDVALLQGVPEHFMKFLLAKYASQNPETTHFGRVYKLAHKTEDIELIAINALINLKRFDSTKYGYQ